jgi:hypothetical protein
MKSFSNTLLFILCLQTLLAQKNNGFNITVGTGPSYFFNDKTIRRKLNNTASVGINYSIANKNQNLQFCPAFNLQFSKYRSQIVPGQLANVNQNSFCLNLDVLLRYSKKSLLRVGLFFSQIYSSNIDISTKIYNGRGYYGYDALSENYFPANTQAGFTLGFSFPFQLFKREQKFNIKLTQTVSRLVDTDYILSENLIGHETKVLSAKALPTAFVLGFDFSLKKLKKKKKVEEEE